MTRLLFIIFLIVLTAPAVASDDYGNCDDYEQNHQPLTEGVLKVIRAKAPVYKTPQDQTAIQELDFNDGLLFVAKNDHKVQVRKADQANNTSLGWMNAKDLLCIHKPLHKDGSQREMVFYVAMKGTKSRLEEQAVSAYDAMDSEHSIYKLGRFKPYFVFDIQTYKDNNGKTHQRYLLGDRYGIANVDDGLSGWVDTENGFLWDHAFGLRPKEELGNDRTICAYKTPEAAQSRSQSECNILIAAGDSWYKTNQRLVIIDDEHTPSDTHKIITISPAVGVCGQSGDEQVLCPEAFVQVYSTDKFKYVDVMFLLDGTQSMSDYMASTKESVNKIKNELRNHENLKGKIFRFGLQVYRDSYAGAKNLGDNLSLPSDCMMQDQALDRNISDFDQALARAKTTTEQSTNSDDDFQENLFGGLQAAVQELRSSCEDHWKILFVIGDHGGKDYSKVETYLKMNLKATNKQDPLITFFLHVPKSIQQFNNQGDYDKSYGEFTTQANTIIGLFLDGSKIKTGIDKFNLNLNGNINSAIINTLKSVLSSNKDIEALRISINGGQMTNAIIDKLAPNNESGPVLALELLKDRVCRDLPGQCDKDIYDKVTTAFIPKDNSKLQYDTWFTSESLGNYITFLANASASNNPDRTTDDLRDIMVRHLITSLENLVKKPLYSDLCPDGTNGSYQGNDCSLSQYMENLGKLPVRKDGSPLLKYSYTELMDRNKVADCVIDNLTKWLEAKHTMLQKAIGDNKAVAHFLSTESCPQADKNSNIDTVEKEGFCDKYNNNKENSCQKMSFCYVPKLDQGGTDTSIKICWIPQEYLP